MAAPSPRLLLQRCTAPSTFSRAVPRRSVARTAARRALEQHGRTTAHGDPNAPLDVPRDGVERQALAMSKEAGDLGTVREDMFDDSKDFSYWRYGALAGGVGAIMLYQELLIDDDAFPVAGYDLDRREAYDRRFEGSSLYRGIKRAIVREGRDPFEKIAAQADDLVDDVHAGRVTQVWNEYSKPEVRHLYLPSRPFTEVIGHVSPSFPVHIDGMHLRTEQAWLNRPPSEAEQAEASGGAESGGGDEEEKEEEE